MINELMEKLRKLPFRVEIHKLYSKDTSGNFIQESLNSSESKLKSTSIYGLPSLLRVMAIKSKIADVDNSNSSLILDDYSMCKVSNWSTFDKRVIIYHFDSLKNFNHNIFQKFLEEAQPIIEQDMVQELGPAPKDKYIRSRIFPRYNVSKFKILLSSKDRPKIKVLDLSASGLKIISKNNFTLNSPVKFELNYLNYTVPISCIPLWSEFENEGENFYLGCKLSLRDSEQVDQWIKLMNAIHLFFEKNI